MTLALNTTVRNARLDAITSQVGSGGKLTVYNGTQPANGGTATTALATFTWSGSFAGSASGGVLTVTLPPNATGVAAGQATWFRLTKADGTTQSMDGTVGTSGTDLILNTTTISIGLTLSITSFTVTDGNP